MFNKLRKLREKEAVLKATLDYLHKINTSKITGSYYHDKELDCIGELAKVQHRIRESDAGLR